VRLITSLIGATARSHRVPARFSSASRPADRGTARTMRSRTLNSQLDHSGSTLQANPLRPG